MRRRICYSSINLLLALVPVLAAAQKPVVTIDLVRLGMPQDFFSRKPCTFSFNGYRAVRWLDEHQLLVAFNTTPDCTAAQRAFSGQIRIVSFDLQGHVLNQAETSYEPGPGNLIRPLLNDGIWIGANQTVLIEVPGNHFEGRPETRDKVVVLSSELKRIQEIDTDSHGKYYDRINFEGVKADHSAVMFWTSDGNLSHPRKCLLYSGTPLQESGTCSTGDLDLPIVPNEYSRTSVFPKSYEIRAFVGRSSDGSRAALFGVRKSSSCELLGWFCPSSGKVVVFDPMSGRVIFELALPLGGRAELSPDGKHLATLEANNLEIFSVR